jgi:hypothetical protein
MPGISGLGSLTPRRPPALPYDARRRCTFLACLRIINKPHPPSLRESSPGLLPVYSTRLLLFGSNGALGMAGESDFGKWPMLLICWRHGRLPMSPFEPISQACASLCAGLDAIIKFTSAKRVEFIPPLSFFFSICNSCFIFKSRFSSKSRVSAQSFD